VKGRPRQTWPNIATGHILDIFKIIPLFGICHGYAPWLYSAMSAVVVPNYASWCLQVAEQLDVPVSIKELALQNMRIDVGKYYLV
jgi:hypothetical protein